MTRGKIFTPPRLYIEAIGHPTILYILYTMVSVQQMNLLPENPYQNDTISRCILSTLWFACSKSTDSARVFQGKTTHAVWCFCTSPHAVSCWHSSLLKVRTVEILHCTQKLRLKLLHRTASFLNAVWCTHFGISLLHYIRSVHTCAFAQLYDIHRFFSFSLHVIVCL